MGTPERPAFLAALDGRLFVSDEDPEHPFDAGYLWHVNTEHSPNDPHVLANALDYIITLQGLGVGEGANLGGMGPLTTRLR